MYNEALGGSALEKQEIELALEAAAPGYMISKVPYYRVKDLKRRRAGRMMKRSMKAKSAAEGKLNALKTSEASGVGAFLSRWILNEKIKAADKTFRDAQNLVASTTDNWG